MARKFLDLALTPSVRRAQAEYYGTKPGASAPGVSRDLLGPDEIEFIEARDSFYLASVGETGWPYLQHRGGAPGFLHVIEPGRLAFADYQGNRQLISTGNLAANDRVALFLMDYPQRTRLKILGHARTEDARKHPALLTRLAAPAIRAKVERLFLIEIEAFDWNCPKYITPRFTAPEIEAAVKGLKDRIPQLEAQLKKQDGL